MAIQKGKKVRLGLEDLEGRIAPSNGNFPPGQFPSGNPAHAPGTAWIKQLPSGNLTLAPGLSNPNEVPATNPSND